MEPKQGDFNLVNNGIPHIETVIPRGFVCVSFDILNFILVLSRCVWPSQKEVGMESFVFPWKLEFCAFFFHVQRQKNHCLNDFG